jgi:Recombinase zinc beta ribbon domain
VVRDDCARHADERPFAGQVNLGGESFPAVGPDGTPTHEPIIDQETWDRAREIRQATSQSRGGGRGRRPAGPHLFTSGLLICSCGAPMSTVTKATRTPGKPYERYVCARRLHHSPKACSQPPVKRELVDGAVWKFVGQIALDVEATKAAVTAAHNAKLGELGMLRTQTEQEIAKAQSELARIRGDYRRGAITATDWAEFRDELTAELEGGEAQLAQLARQHESLQAEVDKFDVEGVVLNELTAMRSLIVGDAQAGSREGVDSFRVALRRLFDHFELVPWGTFPSSNKDSVIWQGDTPLNIESHKLALIPYVRPEAIDWDSDQPEFPALRRVALSLRDNLSARLVA